VVRGLLSAILAGVPANQVELQLDACLSRLHEIDPEALREAVELESLDESLPPVTSVHVGCRDGGLVLHRADPAPAIDRSLEIQSLAPQVRTRVLALAIVELLMQPPPPTVAPTPAAKPPPIPVDAGQGVVAVPRPRPWQLGVGASARLFVPSSWIVGGRLAVAHRPRPRLGWRAAVDASGARYGSDLGMVSVFSVSGAVGVLGYEDLARNVRLSGGAGAMVGWSRIWGEPSESVVAASLSGVWLGPVGDLIVDFKVAPAWSLGLGIELGYAILGVQAFADDQVVAGLDGFWVGASIQANWALPLSPR